MTTGNLAVQNLFRSVASSEAMSSPKPFRFSGRADDARRLRGRSDPLEGPGPWIAFAVGLLLMLAAAIVRGDEGAKTKGGDDSATARKTERFNATVSPRSTVRVLNVSGDVVATPGREFSATCSTTVTASTKARADEILGQTRTVQSRDGDELTLEAEWPDMDRDGRSRSHGSWSSRRGWQGSARCVDCKISMRYEVVIPPGVTTVLRTVIGDVSVQDLDGELDVQSVNGNVIVRGSRRAVNARSVNGKVDVTAAAAPAGAGLELKTVNGSVILTLPKEAKFDVVANTMTGSILTSFPLPVRDSRGDEATPMPDDPHPPAPPASAPKAEIPRTPRTPRPVVVERDGDSAVVDVAELERELAESMREVETEVRHATREIERQTRHMKIALPGGEYKGSIGQGGAQVRLSTLNGKIVLLASGTREADARSIMTRRSVLVTMPPVAVRPQIRVHVAPPAPPAPRAAIAGEDDEEETVVRGNVTGDFLANGGSRGYRIGNVTGKVHILTHQGEIHVASAGSGAELKTYGGDIRVGPVTGDLKAQTLAGDIVAKAVSGAAVVETSGGDIRVERIGSSAEARTGGGDIVLRAVGGGVIAETSGGEIQIVVLAREPKNGIRVRNSGGDVTLTVPANFKGDFDLAASGVDSDDTAIRSDFPEIAVTRRSHSQEGAGSLNGGGPKVYIRTSSGSIRIRKGAPAS